MRLMMKASFAATAVIALFLFGPVVAYSDEAAPVLIVAGKSIDTVDHLAKEMGLDLPPFLTAAGIEQALPFVGQGGIAPNKPIGIIVAGLANTPPDKSWALVLPVNPGKATVDSFKAFGGQVMEGHADTVVINGAALRRTADYLIFSTSPAVAVAIDTQTVVDVVSKPEAVLRVVGDVKAFREKMPDLLQQVYKGIENEANKDPSAKMGTDVFKHWVDTINRIELGFDVADHGARIYATASPVPLPPVAAVNLPGMPAGVIGRVDMAMSLDAQTPGFGDAVEKLIDSGEKDLTVDGKPATGDERKQFHSVMRRAVELFRGPDATSVGFEMADGKPVVYIVQHLAKQTDVLAEVRGVVEGLNPLLDKGEKIELQNLEGAGGKVLRLAFTTKGKPDGCADIVQRGDVVYTAISPGEGHHLAGLLAAANGEPMKALMTASLDLGKLIDGMAQAPDSPIAGMPQETKKELADLLHDQTVRVVYVHEGDGVKYEVKIDRALFEKIPKLTKLLGIGPKRVNEGL